MCRGIRSGEQVDNKSFEGASGEQRPSDYLVAAMVGQ